MPWGVKHVHQVGLAPRIRHHEGEGRGLDAQATLQGGGAIVIGGLVVAALRTGVDWNGELKYQLLESR